VIRGSTIKILIMNDQFHVIDCCSVLVDSTEGNDAAVPLLWEKLGFEGLTMQLSMFQPSASALEERWQQSERQIAELRFVSADGDSRAGDRSVGAMVTQTARRPGGVGDRARCIGGWSSRETGG
jgi:hypothetical protein